MKYGIGANTKWSLGFGLEMIGVAVLRRPVFYSLAVLASIAVALIFAPRIVFEGNVTVILPKETKSYQDFEELKSEFRDFTKDWYIVLQSDDMFTAKGMEELRNFQLDASLEDGVKGISTLLSIPRIDPQTGEIGTYFPDEFDSDQQVMELLENLQKTRPEFNSLFSLDNNAVLMVVNSVNLEKSRRRNKDDEGLEVVNKNYEHIYSEIQQLKPADMTMAATGLYAIALTISNAMINDQIRLTISGMALGAIISFFIFRSIWAAFICTLPPAITILWSLAAFGITGIEINFLSTILPMLALILAFADGIVLYFKWERMNHSGGDLIDNLKLAIVRVGPASALTSITTALAFLSFAILDSEAMRAFAYMGALCVGFAFLSVIINLPLLLYWGVKSRRLRRRDHVNPKLSKIGTMFGYLSADSPKVVAVGAIVLVLALIYPHFQLHSEYKITDYLPKESEAYKAEKDINAWFGGRSTVLAMLPVRDTTDISSPKNQEMLATAQSIMGKALETSSVYSIKSLWDEVDNQQAIETAMNYLEEEGGQAQQNYISKDGKQFLMAARIPTDQSIIQTIADLDRLQAGFDNTSFGDKVRFTGFPVLMAREYTVLVQQLRQSLLLAIVLGVCILGIATGSAWMALAAITPNLLPILFLEAMIYLDGGVISLAQVVGLTLGFGVAIDNAVHFLNIYLTERSAGRPRYDSAMFSVREVGPALAASTLIVCSATSVILFSTLPVAPILGLVIISVLVLALFANLALLPANVLILEHWRNRSLARKRLRKRKSNS